MRAVENLCFQAMDPSLQFNAMMLPLSVGTKRRPAPSLPSPAIEVIGVGAIS